jgi:CotH kinase protein/Putative metal-binding motif
MGDERRGNSPGTRRLRLWLCLAVAWPWLVPACAGSASPTTELRPGRGGTTVSGTAGSDAPSGTGGAAGNSGTAGGPGCSDLFAPTLQTFSIDVGASDWAAIQTEFVTIGQLADSAFVQYTPVNYPVAFHYGSETVNDAFIRLRGDSSWREAVEFDGANGKMQFSIAFDQTNPNASFHGIGKLKFDMPRTDPTFLRDRIANSWLRSIGVPAICTTSAQLMVNGNLYGVFVAEDHAGNRLLKQFFPGNSDGDLFDGGWTAVTNQLNPNTARLKMFWNATTPAAVSAIIDVPGSVLSWAAEALLNDGDGYWGGDHNFYIYDQGAKGYLFFPHDLDSSLDYLGRFDSDPITWWSVRNHWDLPIPQHYLVVMGDDGLRKQYIEALRTQLGRYDVTQLQSWIDAWSAQIRSAVDADPHKPADTTIQDFDTAVALARRGVAERADYVKRWLACRDSGAGADDDGDGVIWCNDCRDDLASVHPGAAETCGNMIDDNCNGVLDDGC